MDVVVETGSVFADVSGKYPVAGADLVQLMDQFDGVFDCSGAGVGAIVFGFILFQHA